MILGTKTSNQVGTIRPTGYPNLNQTRVSANKCRNEKYRAKLAAARDGNACRAEVGPWFPVGKVALVGASLALGAVCSSPAQAFSETKIGEFNASGLIFKDAVEVVAIDDPDVEGVTLYYSDFKRSFADKLSKMDFFNEPSQASITCAATGRVQIKDGAKVTGSAGREVFSEEKSRALLFFGNKTLKIRRIYDEGRQALLYVSYSTRLTSAGEDNKGVSAGRYKTSICAIPLAPSAPPLAAE